MADAKQPMTFELPDFDNVNLITWEYVLYQLDKRLGTSLTSMETINELLWQIDAQLDEWIPEEEVSTNG